VHRFGGLDIRQFDYTGQGCRFQPTAPDRATELMRHHPVLQLTDATTKLDQLGAQAGIIGLANIAGDQMIRQAKGRRDRK